MTALGEHAQGMSWRRRTGRARGCGIALSVAALILFTLAGCGSSSNSSTPSTASTGGTDANSAGQAGSAVTRPGCGSHCALSGAGGHADPALHGSVTTVSPPSEQIESNDVASVALPADWSRAQDTTTTYLHLDGPDGIAIELDGFNEQPGYSLDQYFQARLSQFQQDQDITTAEVCAKPSLFTLPGTSTTNDAQWEGICYTYTPPTCCPMSLQCSQGAELLTRTGSATQLLLTAAECFPTSLSDAQLRSDTEPVFDTLKWRALAESG